LEAVRVGSALRAADLEEVLDNFLLVHLVVPHLKEDHCLLEVLELDEIAAFAHSLEEGVQFGTDLIVRHGAATATNNQFDLERLDNVFRHDSNPLVKYAKPAVLVRQVVNEHVEADSLGCLCSQQKLLVLFF